MHAHKHVTLQRLLNSEDVTGIKHGKVDGRVVRGRRTLVTNTGIACINNEACNL
jgi:hypothetical protein